MRSDLALSLCALSAVRLLCAVIELAHLACLFPVALAVIFNAEITRHDDKALGPIARARAVFAQLLAHFPARSPDVIFRPALFCLGSSGPVVALESAQRA